jgi:hypothetical protein
MFHRSIAYLSVASLFLLSASSTNTMDLNLDLLKSLPLELCPRIDTFIPPITVQEKILDAAEHTQYNLPFKFNPTEAIAESQLGQLGGCSVRYQDPKSGESRVIHTTYGKPNFHCLGPCRIKQHDEICLLKDSRDRISGVDYTIWTLKKDLEEDFAEPNGNHFIKYLKYSSPYAQSYCNYFEYVVDIDNEAQIFYTANSDGAIKAYRYNQNSDSCTGTLIKPSMHRIYIKFAIQFDHTQPDISLVRIHDHTTAYSVVHRPTGYIQFFPGQKIDYHNDHQNIFPLLASTSESRLRLFGDNVGVKLVTVTPIISCCAIRTLQLVKSAQTRWEQWQGTALDKQAARDIIAAFKTLIPQSADRYFYVWCSKHENSTYALSELYNAQK